MFYHPPSKLRDKMTNSNQLSINKILKLIPHWNIIVHPESKQNSLLCHRPCLFCIYKTCKESAHPMLNQRSYICQYWEEIWEWVKTFVGSYRFCTLRLTRLDIKSFTFFFKLWVVKLQRFINKCDNYLIYDTVLF